MLIFCCYSITFTSLSIILLTLTLLAEVLTVSQRSSLLEYFFLHSHMSFIELIIILLIWYLQALSFFCQRGHMEEVPTVSKCQVKHQQLSSHPHSLCIQLVRRKYQSDSFFSRMVTLQYRLPKRCFLDHYTT